MSRPLFSAKSPDIESAACSHMEERHEDTEKPTLTGLTSVAVTVGWKDASETTGTSRALTG